jgi:DNA-binding MarR family transcriptional regulator
MLSKSFRVARAADGLRRIVQVLRVSSHRIESRYGVSGAQLFVLRQLALADGASLAELAAQTRTDPSSVSVAVSRLVARGLVRRVRSNDDRRRARVTLSARGRELMRRAPEPAQARLIGALEGFSSAQLTTFAVSLDTIARALGAPEGPPAMFFERAPAALEGGPSA